MNRGEEKAEEKGNNHRSKVLEKVREERSKPKGELVFHRNGESFVTDQSADRLCMRRGCSLVDLMWEDERVWLESLALNPLVCLFDNQIGRAHV